MDSRFPILPALALVSVMSSISDSQGSLTESESLDSAYGHNASTFFREPSTLSWRLLMVSRFLAGVSRFLAGISRLPLYFSKLCRCDFSYFLGRKSY